MTADNTKKPKRKTALLIKDGRMDVSFLLLVLAILSIGLIMLFSASYAYAYTNFGDSYKFIIRQAGFAIVGIAGMIFVSHIDYHRFMKFSWLIYGVSIVLLMLVYFLPSVEGYHRWIIVGPINFQPSEIAKFAVILLFSHLIAINYNAMKTAKFSIFFLGFLLAIVCGLVVFETHLSATILIFSIGLILMIAGGLKKRYMIIGLVLVIAAIAVAIATGIVGYWSDRFKYWLDPWSDATGNGYQVIQSLMSIGSGGLFGRGLGQSMQKHLWVPEPHNDFIFAIVCEELGLVGAMIIITLFCLLVWRGFKIAMKAEDKFGSLLAIGLVCQVGLQAMLNIMVVTNTIPNTGISLPFFSYGGTSLVILLLEMGVVLSVSRFSSVTKN